MMGVNSFHDESSIADDDDNLDQLQDIAEQPRYNLRRNRLPPQWMQKGDYVLNQCQTLNSNTDAAKPDWERKASFLASLAAQHSFLATDAGVCQAILRLVSKS